MLQDHPVESLLRAFPERSDRARNGLAHVVARRVVHALVLVVRVNREKLTRSLAKEVGRGMPCNPDEPVGNLGRGRWACLRFESFAVHGLRHVVHLVRRDSAANGVGDAPTDLRVVQSGAHFGREVVGHY